MSPWALVMWLYSQYTSIAKECVLLHGAVWTLLSMILQGFIGWGLLGIVLYRVYAIKTGIRNFAEEFASYGLPLPGVMVILVCLIEFGFAAIFTAGIVVPDLVFLNSFASAALMLLAVLARIKGNEPWQKMIPAATCGMISLVCIVIDQSATISDSVFGSFTSSRGRVALMICVMAADLGAIGVTVYRYYGYFREKEENHNCLNERLVHR